MMKKEIKPGKYRHYKGGLYMVEDIATHSENEEKMVVYRPLYGEQGLWVRPFDMFMEEVEIEGRKQSRFVFIG
ncbi:MAG TPA: DUF1653 domain-containing protein [Psychromonas sp.]